MDQLEGLKDPTIECWTTEEEDDGDPPRLWFPNGMYPGTAFTRSIGDAGGRGGGVRGAAGRAAGGAEKFGGQERAALGS
jgi:hypothetical protein